jgi:2-iminobutanoate/2-iminopropanoate deaminase
VKQLVTSDHAPASVGPFSPALAVGDWLFLSGQGGFDPATDTLVADDVTVQTEQTFRNIEALLEAAGASLDDVVSCLVHLVDLGDFAEFNAAYERQFPGVKPVRTTVRADLVAGMRVEITVIAQRTTTVSE